jgi:glycosyltransferase involved in cell wall biosynthesis
VARAIPDVGFVHFGDGPLRGELANRVERLGLASRFIFVGFRTNLARWMPNLDLFALPSFTEGLPVVVLETFAAGVPVVASAVGGTPEVVVDGVNGRPVHPGAPAALATAILELLDARADLVAMGACGRRLVRSRFSFAAQAEAYRSLFAALPTPGRPLGRAHAATAD